MYWATNHLLTRLYFDSNTQETTTKQMYPSEVASFRPLGYMNRNPAKVFECSRSIYMYFVSFFMRENDVTPSSVVEMKTDATKQIN